MKFQNESNHLSDRVSAFVRYDFPPSLPRLLLPSPSPPFPFSKRPIVGLFPQHNHRSIMKPVIYPRNDHENHFNREGRGVHGVVLFPSCCHVKLPNEFPSAYRATSYRPSPFLFFFPSPLWQTMPDLGPMMITRIEKNLGYEVVRMKKNAHLRPRFDVPVHSRTHVNLA